MTRDDIQKVFDALLNLGNHADNCKGISIYKSLPCSCGRDEAIAILDTALAQPPSKEYLVRDLTGAEIYKLWREHPSSSISTFVRRCFMVASGRIKP